MKAMIEEALSKKDLIELFQSVGVKPGMILAVHTALSKFGYVIGGAETFNDALIELLGYNGTLIMPMQCGSHNEPSYFRYPPMERELYAKYRENLPSFDSLNSETEMMSKVVDNLRRRNKAVISYHPNLAFVAYGKYARMLCGHHELNFGLSDTSPLGRLYELRAYCLLAGVSYDNMTALHLSEYRSLIRPIILQGSKLDSSWQKYYDLDLNSDDGFNVIGKRLEMKDLVKKISLKKGDMRLLRIDLAVDEGLRYFEERLRHYQL